MNIKGSLKKAMTSAGNSLALVGSHPEKKIVFESFHGKQYSDNPRAISEAMHRLDPTIQLVWGVEDPEKLRPQVPEYVRLCQVDTPAYRRERATAAAYVRNEAMTEDLRKGKGQLYIQTWHGDRGIKRIVYDARAREARGTQVVDDALTDLFVVGSDYAEKRIQTAFAYHGETLKAGCPRNDCLVHPAGGEKIREKLGIKPGQKLLLYAPTLRKGHKVVEGTLNLAETLAALQKRDGASWVGLMRAHPKSLGLRVQDGGDVVDVSAYPDMSDLLMIADALITDYSSCAGDFLLRKKPLILAQFDLAQYNEEERSFYVDPAEAGFLIARSQAELGALLQNTTDRQFAENCERVLAFFGTRETGSAAEACCRWILERSAVLRGK